jgi:hypothetical protein
MCYQEISHYRCGHKKEDKVRKCQDYRQERAEPRTLLHQFMKPFSRSPRHCGDLQYVNQDITSICSSACVRMRENMRKKQLMQSHERARATAREYKKRKEDEEREARREKEEDEEKSNGRSRLPVLKRSVIQTLWKTALGGTTGYTGLSGRPVAKQPQQPRPTREEAQRAPARLTEADRRILPQPYRPRNHLASPPTLPHSRTQANMVPQGHQTRVPRNQPRTPLAPSTNGHNRSRRRQPERSTTENSNNLPARFEANRFPSQARTERQQHPAQPVTARGQAAVNPPANIPQPSQGRMSRSSQGPPPPVPPKDPWRPHHPHLAPAPLAPRPRESGARLTALRAARQASLQHSDIPIGYSPEQPPTRAPSHRTRTMPQQRTPVGSGVSTSSARPQKSQRQRPGTVPEYRPNPVFANRQGQRPAGMSAAASPSSTRQPTSSRSRQQPRSNTNTITTNTSARRLATTLRSTTAAPKKPVKKRSWFKKLVGPSSSSDSSVEWVSQDAARIERGGSSR